MAKFKVGDKVRVRRDLNIGECYSGVVFVKGMNKYKGEIIEIEDIADDDIVFLKDINFAWLDEMLEEVKENKMEKTFREVIADIKEGEVWESIQDYFQLKEVSCLEERIRFKFEGVFIEEIGSRIDVDTGLGNGQTFKLKRKEYTFEEAFKAYEEGKEIESLESKEKIRKIDDDCRFTSKEIRGKWYINE